jgi:hypothetical protein
MPLSVDDGLAGLALRLPRVELLIEPLIEDLRVSIAQQTRALRCVPLLADPRHRRASGPIKALARLARPKNRGPDQCAPVIFSAITVRER